MQLLHILSVSSLPVYFIVRSLVNHVTDERKKEAAKARATAGKCHDIIIVLLGWVEVYEVTVGTAIQGSNVAG